MKRSVAECTGTINEDVHAIPCSEHTADCRCYVLRHREVANRDDDLYAVACGLSRNALYAVSISVDQKQVRPRGRERERERFAYARCRAGDYGLSSTYDPHLYNLRFDCLRNCGFTTLISLCQDAGKSSEIITLSA